MKGNGFEYFLNAVYYWTWSKNIWMGKTIERVIKFFLLSTTKLFLPKDTLRNLKNMPLQTLRRVSVVFIISGMVCVLNLQHTIFECFSRLIHFV